MLLPLTAVISGCVTTQTGGFTEKASPEEALERRVELARQYIGEGNWDAAKRLLRRCLLSETTGLGGYTATDHCRQWQQHY